MRDKKNPSFLKPARALVRVATSLTHLGASDFHPTLLDRVPVTKMARPRSLLLTAIPVVSNLISLILLSLIIFSGINNHLTQFHWLTVSPPSLLTPTHN